MVTLTEAAAKTIKEATKDASDNNCFRIYVQGGGCSGFSYGMVLDQKKDDDMEFQSNGVTIVVDPMSIRYLEDVTIDLKEGLGGGLYVQNPNAKSTCGCGHSFSADQDEHKEQ